MTAVRTEIDPDLVLSTNINTLMFWSHTTGRGLAAATSIAPGVMARRLKERRAWTVAEAVAIADHFDVSLDELTGGLPSFDDWSARWSVRHVGLEPTTR